MRVKIEIIVYICMAALLYHNLTYFPKQRQIVRGPLIKIGVNHENMDYKRLALWA